MKFMTCVGLGLVLTGLTLYSISVLSKKPKDKAPKGKEFTTDSSDQKKEEFVLETFICENISSFSNDVFTIHKISTYSGGGDRYEFLVGDSVSGFSRDYCNVRDAKLFYKDTIPCVKLFIWKNKDRLFSQKNVVEIYLPHGAVIEEVGGMAREPVGRGF